jgi:hypothetical protein
MDIIEQFLTLSAARDVEAFVDQFAPGAVVTDDGGTHRGRDELRAWRRDVPQVSYALQHAEPTDDGAEADVVIAGDFPGSPVELHYTVGLDDEGRIARLEIRPRVVS